jgi:hypothetical protein
MAFKQCSYCDRPFNAVGSTKVCLACRAMLDEAYLQIRSYIYKNPTESNMVTVSESLEIPEKVISMLIDEGKLEFAGFGAATSRCKVCGAACIGVLCEKCKGTFVTETKNLGSRLEEESKKKAEEKTIKGIKIHINKNRP